MSTRHLTREEFTELLNHPEAERFVDHVVDVLREVYEYNQQRHNEEVGDDSQTFGYLVYRNGWYAIEEVVSDLPGIRTSRPKNSLLVRLEGSGKRFHVYRGGADETYDIETFDLQKGTMTKRSILEVNQLRLLLWDDIDEAVETLDELVIVHSGNHVDGLIAVWAGAPANNVEADSPWAFLVDLFRRGGSDTGRRKFDDGSGDPTPFSERDVPDVRLEPEPESERATEGK